MQLVEQHRIDRHDPRWVAIDLAAFASKNLYNAALYLTLHGGSSPMGSQATGLMGCLFHPCPLAPEGGAPAYVDVACIARRARLYNKTLAQAHGTSSKAR